MRVKSPGALSPGLFTYAQLPVDSGLVVYGERERWWAAAGAVQWLVAN
jgi:hypothetical protein